MNFISIKSIEFRGEFIPQSSIIYIIWSQCWDYEWKIGILGSGQEFLKSILLKKKKTKEERNKISNFKYISSFYYHIFYEY